MFSANGMSPDLEKIKIIQQWPQPTTISDVRRFHGLASYYRRYIRGFSSIAEPLLRLMDKDAEFHWTPQCEKAFRQLKELLTKAPVLICPSFDKEFQLTTDASGYGLGAVLEQEGHPVAFASRTLTPAEKNYSVIQRECLAIVYATKQFRHYLLGRHFALYTDHSPLLWLSAQKMEGLLCRWALSLQEFNFTIKYCKGSTNNCADALSRQEVQMGDKLCATTGILAGDITEEDIRIGQHEDSTLRTVLDALTRTTTRLCTKAWKQFPLRRFAQLWSQLQVTNGILYCNIPQPADVTRKVLVVPKSLIQTILHMCHDVPGAGHQGFDKTLARVQEEAYWVGMTRDVNHHCTTCEKCQAAKLNSARKAPMQNVPVGRPWQMVAVDILEVPLSIQGNRYIIVIQDYFTKWLEAIALKDQTADTITKELIVVFGRFGMPQFLHSDQGRNFESTLLRSTLEAFGVEKTRTTAYHPQGDGMVERANRSILQMLRTFVEKKTDWERWLPLMLYAYRTSKHPSTGRTPFEVMFGRTQGSLVHGTWCSVFLF